MIKINIVKIKSFGYHLSTNKHVVYPILEISYYILITSFGSVRIHNGYFGLWDQLYQLLGYAFGIEKRGAGR